MYYRLKGRYVLRGWQRLPYALRDTQTGGTAFLDETAFQAISFCNGMLDIDNPLLLPVHRETISKLVENGIVERCNSGDAIHEEQKYRLFPCRFMNRAHWSITGKCNLRCRHCYLGAPQARYGELSLEQCLDIARQLSEAGIPNVSITGGEPLVRKDFFNIVDALLGHKIVITQIYTNGMLIKDGLLSEFDKRGIKPEFSLSFDGVGCHDWLRGVEGAEKIAIDAIRLLRSMGFPVAIETALHTRNLHTLSPTLDLLVELGVRNWKTTPASDAGNWLNEGGKLTVNVQQLYDAYLDLIPKYRATGAPLSIMLGGFFMCGQGSNKYRIPCKKFDGTEKMLRQPICQSARTTMYIGPDGRLLPCIPLTGLPVEENLPFVTETSVCEALSDSRYLGMIDIRLEDLLKVNKECSTCEHRLYCGGGCRAGAMLCSGSYLGRDDWTCHFFKDGYEEKIAELYSQ